MFDIVESLVNLWKTTGIYQMLFTDGQLDMAFIKTLIMLAVSGVLIYLAIGKGFEPLLLLPIAFGMLLANLPVPDFSIRNSLLMIQVILTGRF